MKLSFLCVIIENKYNWSKNAIYNGADIIVVENEIIANVYKENFNELIKEYVNNQTTLVS